MALTHKAPAPQKESVRDTLPPAHMPSPLRGFAMLLIAILVLTAGVVIALVVVDSEPIELYDSWMNAPGAAQPIELYDSWMNAPGAAQPIELYDSWMNAPGAAQPVELYDSWMGR